MSIPPEFLKSNEKKSSFKYNGKKSFNKIRKPSKDFVLSQTLFISTIIAFDRIQVITLTRGVQSILLASRLPILEISAGL